MGLLILKDGFTLIELMITVGIIGVLAVIALPAYQDYVIKAQISEGLLLAEGIKVDVAAFYAETGDLTLWDPRGSQAFAYSALQGKYVSSATVNFGGNIVVRYGNEVNQKIDGYALSIMPVTEGNNLQWHCMAPGWPLKYVPKGCVKT